MEHQFNTVHAKMRPDKIGQIARFHTPLPGENPNQLYVVLEIIEDDERPRAKIKALNTGLSFPPINLVNLNDLEVMRVDTEDLIGQYVTINKPNCSQESGKVIKVREQKIMLDLSLSIKGVETNVWLTIVDDEGLEHTGTLYVNTF